MVMAAETEEARPITEAEIAAEANETIEHLRSVVAGLAPIKERASFYYNLGLKTIHHYHHISEGDTLAELLAHEPDSHLVRMKQEKPEEPNASAVNIAIARVLLGPNARLLDLPPKILTLRRLPEGVTAELDAAGYSTRESYSFSAPTIIPELEYRAEVDSSIESVRVRHTLIFKPS